MDILDAIFTRRSIRKYTGETVKDEQLEIILKAGFFAPSAHNRQPWHFVVVKQADKLKTIAENHRYAKMLPQAGCAIIVCGEKQIDGMTDFVVEDCSAAIENILLAAHGIGLGTVWCGIYPVSKYVRLLSDLLELPHSVIPVGMVVVGNADETRTVTDRYNKSKIHKDNW